MFNPCKVCICLFKVKWIDWKKSYFRFLKHLVASASLSSIATLHLLYVSECVFLVGVVVIFKELFDSSFVERKHKLKRKCSNKCSIRKHFQNWNYINSKFFISVLYQTYIKNLKQLFLSWIMIFWKLVERILFSIRNMKPNASFMSSVQRGTDIVDIAK